MTLSKPSPVLAVGQGGAFERAYPPGSVLAIQRPASHALNRPAARREPRLGDRGPVVRADIGARIPPSTRQLVDRLCDIYKLSEAETARTLLAGGMFAGLPLRDRIAIALYASGSMVLHQESTRLAEGMRGALAASCGVVARTAPPIPPRAERGEHGPGDATLLRVKLGDLLHRRLRDLVAVYVALRSDGVVPAAGDEATRQLVEHLLRRSPAAVRGERSPVAEVVRWALAAAEPGADVLFASYIPCRTAIFRRLGSAVKAMRTAVEEEIGMALEEIDRG